MCTVWHVDKYKITFKLLINSRRISRGPAVEKHWSSAPEDGRNYRPKHAELIEIINKIIIVASSWLFVLLFNVYTL